MAEDLYQKALDSLSKASTSNEEPVEQPEAQEEVVAEQDKEVLEHTEKETIESSEPEAPIEQPSVLDDETFLKFASEKLGKKLEKWEDLIEKETVEKEREYISTFSEGYDKYHKETGRSPQDYLKLQRDLTTLPKDEVIKESLRIENPTLSDEQVDRLYKRKFNIDEDVMEDSEIEDVKLDIEIAYSHGLKTLEADKEKYAIPKEDSIASLEAKREEQIKLAEETARQWAESIAEANKQLSSVEIDLGEDFKFKHMISPESKSKVKEISQDGSMQKWFQKYQNEDGSIDQVTLQRDVYIRDNWERLIAEAVEQAQGRTVEAISKEDRNIDFKSGKKPDGRVGLSKEALEGIELLKRKGGRL